MLVPRQVKVIIEILNKLPTNELLTSREIAQKLGLAELRGLTMNHPALADHREKVKNVLFWGRSTSIVHLRDKLAASKDK